MTVSSVASSCHFCVLFPTVKVQFLGFEECSPASAFLNLTLMGGVDPSEGFPLFLTMVTDIVATKQSKILIIYYNYLLVIIINTKEVV